MKKLEDTQNQCCKNCSKNIKTTLKLSFSIAFQQLPTYSPVAMFLFIYIY